MHKLLGSWTTRALAGALLITVGCSTADPAADAAARILDGLQAEESREADVVLLAARAHLQLALVDPTHEEPAAALLDRLAGMTVNPGVYGWGLSTRWDAFGDGSVNPASAIYSYTTAAAALAFLDGYEVLRDERYLEVAVAAAHTLVSDTCCWRTGEFASIWYSDQVSDQQEGLQVHNVSGLTLAVLSRLERVGYDIAPTLADALAAHLLDAQGGPWDRPAHAASSNWAYSVSGERANDLLHETFIVEGLAYRPEGSAAVERSIRGMLAVHFDDRFRPAPDVHTLGSLGWGPPAALYVLSGYPGIEREVDAIAAALLDSVAGDGFAVLDEYHPRARAWYALALARYAADQRGKTALSPWGSG